MSRIHLLILWILAITAGIFYFKRKDVDQAIESKTDLEIGADLIGGDTLENIQGFKITEEGETVTVKKIDGQWSVAELDHFPANLSTVTRVFEALRDLKVAQGVPAPAEYYDRFNLDLDSEDPDEQPTTLTFLSGEGEEKGTLFVGKTRKSTGGRGSSAGRFVRLADDDSGVYVVDETFGFLNVKPESWIEKILTPLEEKAIRIEVTAPNDEDFNSWTVSRKTVLDDFILEDLGEKEETKTNETGLLKTAFTRAPFTELVSQEDYDKRANPKGIRQVRATDSAGSTFLITITPEKKEDKPEDEKDNPNTPTPAQNFIVSIALENGPTEPEPLPEDADVQAKAVYQERKANFAGLTEAVARMAADYRDRYFLVSKATVDPFLKNRGELVKPKKEEKKEESVATKPIQVPQQGDRTAPALDNSGNTPGTPPASIARPMEDDKKKPKIEAVTPPIQIPPLPGKKEGSKPDEAVEKPKKPAPAKPDEPTTPGESSAPDAPTPAKEDPPAPKKPEDAPETEPAAEDDPGSPENSPEQPGPAE